MRFVWLILLSLPCRAALIEVADTNLTSINSALATAAAGDVVRFPFEGTFDFGANPINIDKRIVFVGWTREGTIFSRAASSSVRVIHLRNIPTTTTNVCGVAHLTVTGAPNADFGLVGIGGTSGLARTNYNWRVHHVNFNVGNRARATKSIGTQQGLIDYCNVVWTTDQNQQGFSFGNPNYQEQGIPVNSTLNIGLGAATNFVYVENCTIATTAPGDGGVDGYGTARYVIRDCAITNTGFVSSHDNTGGRNATIYEFYRNRWVNDPPGISHRPGDLRAGWGVIWSNVFTSSIVGNPDTLLLSVYRSNNLFPQWWPYSTIATPPSPADSGTTFTVTDTNRFLNSWIPTTLMVWPDGVQPTPANTEVMSATAYSSGSGQFTVTRGGTPISVLAGYQIMATNMVLVVGTNRYDGNQNGVVMGYPALDQPGWGDPTTWGATNQTQTLHGVYEWDNTFNGADMDFSFHGFCTGADPCGSTTPPLECNICKGLTGYDGLIVPVTDELVVDGRDCFNDTSKPGYSPLGAHPLATSATISPAAPAVPAGQLITLTATGTGGAPLIWEFLHNNSGGSLWASVGSSVDYTAGSVGFVDTVRYLDQHGNYGIATITVTDGLPQVTFSASPSTIESGNSSTLTWTTSGADLVLLDGNSVALNGNTNVSPIVTTVYTLISSNAVGMVTNTATVTVVGPSDPPEVNFSATPSTITLGNSSTLTWTTVGADAVTLDSIAVALNGSTNVAPIVTTLYTLIATNTVAAVTNTATVTVTNPPPPTAGVSKGRTRRL